MRRRWRWAILFVAFLLGWLAGELHASPSLEVLPCVRLQVRPRVLLTPHDVDVQAHVARHADHRSLVVSWDSDVGAAGSRTFDLAGATDRVLFQWVNVDQPAGSYVFLALLLAAQQRPPMPPPGRGASPLSPLCPSGERSGEEGRGLGLGWGKGRDRVITTIPAAPSTGKTSTREKRSS